METKEKIKKIILVTILNIVLPTADVFSDLRLIVELWKVSFELRNGWFMKDSAIALLFFFIFFYCIKKRNNFVSI